MNTNDAKVGDYLQLDGKKNYWRIMARDDRYVICTCNMFGKGYYTILDLFRGIRSSDNMLFGRNYETHQDCRERLLELNTHQITLSERNKKSFVVDRIK